MAWVASPRGALLAGSGGRARPKFADPSRRSVLELRRDRSLRHRNARTAQSLRFGPLRGALALLPQQRQRRRPVRRRSNALALGFRNSVLIKIIILRLFILKLANTVPSFLFFSLLFLFF